VQNAKLSLLKIIAFDEIALSFATQTSEVPAWRIIDIPMSGAAISNSKKV
jgi:hypothetical protein